MSLTKNIIAIYAGNIYSIGVGIIILPIYLKLLGPEPYGLIAFYMTIQAWFSILDLGLTPAVARETARYKAGAVSKINFLTLIKVLHTISVFISIAGCLSIYFGADYLANKWLKINVEYIPTAKQSLEIISVAVALRWLSGFYRASITGSENFVWINALNIIIATLRFVFPLVLISLTNKNVLIFFWLQLIVSAIETAILNIKFKLLLPKISNKIKIRWSISPIKKILHFSAGTSLSAIMWICVMQLDKLWLSKTLSINQYGYYTLAVMAASGIQIISNPIGTVLTPRMVKLIAANKYEEFDATYRNLSKIAFTIIFAIGITLALFSNSVIYAWTGNQEIANDAAKILFFHSIGNTFIAIASLPYYLQYAYGKTKIISISNILLFAVLIPTYSYFIKIYGAVGASISWCLCATVYFLLTSSLIHMEYKKGFQKKWLLEDILPAFSIVTITAIFLKIIDIPPTSRFDNLIYLISHGFIILISGLLFVKTIRIQTTLWVKNICRIF